MAAQWVLVTLLLVAIPAHAAIDPAAAKSAFGELREMFGRDAGKLWGEDLSGPTVFVDRDTRHVVANQQTPGDTLPNDIGIANTAVEWGGTQWAMVVWPLPDDTYSRKVLLAHESFHRVQKRLGFATTGPSNAHLDTTDGRLLLQLEWRALSMALQAPPRGRRKAIADALHFRDLRRATFPDAKSDEHDLEMNEGLAEYTGTALAESSLSIRVPHVVRALRNAEKTPTFVRSFAYASGPAYGALLEAADPHWTRALRSRDDLGVLLARKYHLTASARVDSAAYDGLALAAAERHRDAEQQARLRGFQARFLDGPALVLPLEKMNMQFDPNESAAFPGHGTVYPKIHLTDLWGTIDVRRGGALITSDWRKLLVPSQPGDDYTLTLADGWEVSGGAVRRR